MLFDYMSKLTGKWLAEMGIFFKIISQMIFKKQEYGFNQLIISVL